MIITDVKIRKTFEEGPMKAIVSVTFDNELALHDIRVINAREKLFVVMPSRKNPDGTFRDIVHPINATARQNLESAVIAAYNEYLATEALEKSEAGSAADTLAYRYIPDNRSEGASLRSILFISIRIFR